MVKSLKIAVTVKKKVTCALSLLMISPRASALLHYILKKMNDVITVGF